MVWNGRVYIGMWDTCDVNCRVLGYGQPIDSLYKIDSYHTGYVGEALIKYAHR